MGPEIILNAFPMFPAHQRRQWLSDTHVISVAIAHIDQFFYSQKHRINRRSNHSKAIILTAISGFEMPVVGKSIIDGTLRWI